jgi:hypothetical protein
VSIGGDVIYASKKRKLRPLKKLLRRNLLRKEMFLAMEQQLRMNNLTTAIITKIQIKNQLR